jgi:hypothetical protein
MSDESSDHRPVPRRPALAIVSSQSTVDHNDLDASVRSVRRDLARLLRGLQASGRGLANLPDALTTRLAHVDAVTASYLVEPTRRPEQEVRSAALAMRDLERWILQRLSAQELAEVKACEMRFRVDDSELSRPLVQADYTGQPWEERDDVGDDLTERSAVRQALSALSARRLSAVCQRLGLRVDFARGENGEEVPPDLLASARSQAENAVIRTLLDAQLLAILIATLPGDAHRLLAALIRGRIDDESQRKLATTLIDESLSEGNFDASLIASSPTPDTGPAAEISGRWRAASAPARLLRDCGLVYAGSDDGRLWVPVELQRRVDGVLRAFGV